VFIQSFEVDNLRALRAKTKVALIQLMDADGGPADHADMTYSAMATPAGLKAISAYASGVGPSKSMIIPRNALGVLGKPTSFVSDAHSVGLKVHPWTFRRENYFLPVNYKSGLNPAAAGDLDGEIKAYLGTGIDGIFTDNTPEAKAALTKTP
jgi:glycerophosphoryl diester phosphodiesterase